MARLLIAALQAGGHRVTLASRFRSWDDGRTSGRQRRLRTVGTRLAERLVRRWRGADEPPELWFTYHLYHKAPDWLGPAVTAALGLPYVVAEASYAPKQRLGPWAEGLAASAAAMARADAVLALSQADAAGLRGLVAPQRLFHLKPFLDPAPYAEAAAGRSDARVRWWAGTPGPWLLAVAMMREGAKARSYAVLAEALERLADRPWRLAVAGDGPARDSVRRDFEARPAIAGRVRWLGEVAPADLPSLYAAADLLVWPAIDEAYGMALLEAQAAGLAVVAGRCGGVPELVREDQTGLLTPPGDAAAFAAAVAALIRDEPRRAAMAGAAELRAAAEHGFDRAVCTLSRILATFLEGTRRQ